MRYSEPEEAADAISSLNMTVIRGRNVLVIGRAQMQLTSDAANDDPDAVPLLSLPLNSQGVLSVRPTPDWDSEVCLTYENTLSSSLGENKFREILAKASYFNAAKRTQRTEKVSLIAVNLLKNAFLLDQMGEMGGDGLAWSNAE